MGYFNIDFNKYAPSSKQKQPSATPTVQQRLETQVQRIVPPTQPTPTPTSTVTPQPQQVQTPQPEQKKSVFRKAFDLLAKPSELTEKALTKGQGYEKVLESERVRKVLAYSPTEIANTAIARAFKTKSPLERSLETEEGRKTAAFGARMVLDPLNFIPFQKIFSLGGKIVSKLDDVTKASKYVDKFSDLNFIPKVGIDLKTKQIGAGFTNLRSIKDTLGKKFIRGYQLPERYNTLKSEIPTTVGKGTQQIIEKTKEQFKGLSDKAVKAAAKFLEPSGAGSGADLGALKKALGSEFDQLRPVLKDVRKQFKDEVYDLVQRGRLGGEEAKRLLNQGGYFPHVDFAPKSLKEYFIRPKLGEKRSYLLRRKGGTGYTFNAPKAIARRELMQFQDNVIQDFLKDIKTTFGVKIGKGTPAPEGFTEFLSDSRRLQELKGWALPARIAEDLNASIATGGEIGKAIDTFNALWKPTATAMNPGFHFMNVIGNLYNSWLGGMKDPRRFLQAIKGGFDPAEGAILEKSGILARGQFGADIVSRTFDNPAGIDTLKVFDKFRKVGEFFENNARAAFMLDRRQKFLAEGLTDIEASRAAIKEVNKYLFDYLTGLTPFESNVMRRVFPFYTWARFNIPLQLKSMITQPGKNALVSKIVKELNKGGVPGSEDEEITIPTPFKDADGNPVRYRPNLPVQDIFNLNPQRILSMLNPLLKDVPQVIPWLLSGGKFEPTDLYTFRKRTSSGLPFKEQAKDVAGGLAKSYLRPVRTFTKLEAEPTFGSFVRNFLLGGFYPYKKESEEFRKIGEKSKRNSAVREKMRQVRSNSSMTLEEKREEISRLMKLLQ